MDRGVLLQEEGVALLERPSDQRFDPRTGLPRLPVQT